jgi:hypothetical protein
MNILDKINWKILLCLLIFLIIIIMIPLFFYGFKPQEVKQPVASINSHQGESFSLEYPNNVTVASSEITGGGQSLIFQLPQGSQSSLKLETASSSETNNASLLLNTFRLANYQEATLNIGGIPGNEFIGSTVIGDVTVQERAAIFEHKGQIYKLHSIYQSPSRNPEVDNLFSQILASLKFK